MSFKFEIVNNADDSEETKFKVWLNIRRNGDLELRTEQGVILWIDGDSGELFGNLTAFSTIEMGYRFNDKGRLEEMEIKE